ncbi:hypothetical protein Gotri_001413 [Gossypium trilobum]|uniref:Uncharacterized protein n=1 Tax=Gossypium trilobum TaxID=34281 RepID=A0A7J9FEM7_9ROSI|nr:hypothetical protein [Gossypium trilobum]
MEDIKKRWFEKFVEKPHLGLNQFLEAMKHLEGKSRKWYEYPLPHDLEDKAKFVDMMTTSIKHILGLVHSTFHPSLLGIQSKIAKREENFQISRNLMLSTTKLLVLNSRNRQAQLVSCAASLDTC